MERITWTRNTGIGRSGWAGTVNGKRLFTIERGVHQGDGWVLRTLLPWNMKREFCTSGPDTDDSVMKRRAEGVLTAFVDKIGAAFPAPVPVRHEHRADPTQVCLDCQRLARS